MSRVRLSTTVDQTLLAQARGLGIGSTDAALVDAAFIALLASRRAAEIDTAYAAAYDLHPLDEPDDWGDLASFREAVGST